MRIGLRICGVLQSIYGLCVTAIVFFGAVLQAQKGSPSVFTGEFAAPIFLGFGLLHIILGVGLVRLNKIAIYGVIPFSIVAIYVQRARLAEAQPVTLGYFIVYIVSIYLAVCYLIKNRSVAQS